MGASDVMVTRADRALVWLKLLTIFLGGMGTLAVVFLADVMTARLNNPIGVAGVEAVTLSEEAELHHWLGYKIALAQVDDKDVVYHVGKAFALATDPKQKSALDGVLVEHMPAGHFIHTKNILKELLGTKSEPALLPIQLEAKLALLLVKQGNSEEARAQVEHIVAVASGSAKEEVQRVLDLLQKGDAESAGQRLAAMSGAP